MEDQGKLEEFQLFESPIEKMKALPNDRKGQQTMNISAIGTIAIALLIAAVILGLGGTILTTMQGAQTDTVSTTPFNESFSWLGNNTAQSFAQSRVNLNSLVVYCNVSLLTLDANYTVNSFGVTIINLSSTANGMGHNLQLCGFNMTYDYQSGSEAYNASGFGLTGMTTVAEFIPTIAIIAMAAIIIGVLLLFFGRARVGPL